MEKYQDNLNSKRELQNNGVIFINIDSISIGANVSISSGTTIFPNVMIADNVKIGKNCTIHNGVIIKDNVEIKDNCNIFPYANIMSDILINENVNIGQFSIIRNECKIGRDSMVGPSCEICRTVIGCACVIGHKNYIGDAFIFDKVNFGVNASIANTNWVDKFTTYIHESSSIGANATLIAPITIGKNVIIGAGSTVSKNVPDNSLCIARAEAIIKPRKI
ncbi:MAG: DapH/DapD/GlmU-related protein [Mycoplasma sp.]